MFIRYDTRYSQSDMYSVKDKRQPIDSSEKRLFSRVPLMRELVVVLLVKLVILFAIYTIWFSHPVMEPQKTIDQQLLGGTGRS